MCWLLVAVGFASSSCAQGGPPRPNIVLITLDTTRWDHLSCYGHPEKITPNIDKLAQDGVRYQYAITPSSWTLPAHASLFTGMLPTHHSAHFSTDEKAKVDDASGFSFYTLHPMLPTLAEELRKAGYNTRGIIAGPAISGTFGVGRGFDHYDDRLPDVGHPERRADEVSSLAIRGLKEHIFSADPKPFFLFLNYFDPHNPYRSPEPWGNQDIAQDVYNIRSDRYDEVFRGNRDLTKEERSILLSQYRDEIRFMDSEIGRLFNEMKRLEIYDSTLIVVTADHGESFGEHRLLEHGRALYEDLIRVPLIIKYPASEKTGIVERRVSILSVMPTILRYIGHPVPKTVTAGSLDDEQQVLIAEIWRDYFWIGRYGNRFDRDQKAVYEGNHKWVWRSDDRHELYNLAEDPEEKHNLAAARPDIERALQSRLAPLIEESRDLSSLTTPQLDQELKHRLQALGYIQ